MNNIYGKEKLKTLDENQRLPSVSRLEERLVIDGHIVTVASMERTKQMESEITKLKEIVMEMDRRIKTLSRDANKRMIAERNSKLKDYE